MVAAPTDCGDVHLRDRLSAELERLPERLRMTVLLHDVEGFTHREISGILDIPEGTSKARLFEAPARLREALAGVVVLMDARRPFTPHDENLLAWLRPARKRLLVLLSKADKLSRQERTKVLKACQARLASRVFDAEARLFSSLSGEGVEETRLLLDGWLEAARAENKKPPEKGNRTGGETP